MVIDNFRPETLARWGVDPAALAARHGWVWVSVRSEVPGRCFDVVAQARSWMEYAPWVPFYVGDTAAGLWAAFKALAMHAAGRPGHYPIGQASVMQKLVEGELLVDVERRPGVVPWDRDAYGFSGGLARVDYKGEQVREPVRDRGWKLAHLWHDGGRIRV